VSWEFDEFSQKLPGFGLDALEVAVDVRSYGPSDSGSLPAVTFALRDSPFGLQDYLQPDEADALAEVLRAAAAHARGWVYDHREQWRGTLEQALERYADAGDEVLEFLAGGVSAPRHHEDANQEIWLTRIPGALPAGEPS
jgi:hypothetical protein